MGGYTISNKASLTPAERKEGARLAEEGLPPRPATRADCVDGERPCPHVRCKWHTMVDVVQGSLKVNYDLEELCDGRPTCTLDVADAGGATLEEVGQALNVTRERIRQLEVKINLKLRFRFRAIGITEAPELAVAASPLAAAIRDHGDGRRNIGTAEIRAAADRVCPQPSWRQQNNPHHHLYAKEKDKPLELEPPAPPVRPESEPQKEETEMPQKSKLDQLDKKGLKIVYRAVLEGVAGSVLHERLVEAGYEDDLPSAGSLNSFLSRRREWLADDALEPPEEIADWFAKQRVKGQQQETPARSFPPDQVESNQALVLTNGAGNGTNGVGDHLAKLLQQGYLVLPGGMVWTATQDEAIDLARRMRG